MDIIVKILTKVYKIVLRQEPSEQAVLFIQNSQYMVIGGVVASLFSVGFQILAGRFLGSAEYGKYILINSIATMLCLPMFFGINNALVKYNAEKTDFDRQRKIISTATIMIAMFSLGTLALSAIFSFWLAQVFSVPQSFFFVAMVFAGTYVIYTLALAIVQSVHHIKKLSVMNILFNVLELCILLLFVVVFRWVSFNAAVLASIIGELGVLLIFCAYYYKYFTLSIDKFWADKLWRFGSYGVISGIVGVIYSNFDKIIINKFLPISNLGIYAAYYAAFVVPAFFFFGMINTVFYPTVSKYRDKTGIFKKITVSIVYLFSIGLILVLAGGFIILKLYGRGYPFDVRLAVLFGILSLLMCLNGLYNSLMGSVGKVGTRVTTIAGIVLLIVNVSLDVLLIPFIGIAGAALSMIVAYIASTLFIISQKKYYRHHEDSHF